MKIKLLKDIILEGEKRKKNEVIEVTRNIGFGLIDREDGREMFDFKKPKKDKMITSKKRNLIMK